MNNSIKGIKFIGSYMKKYWFSLILVTVFILLSTWLNVMSPKIMGDAIDKMADYVITSVAKDGQDDIKNQITNGEGLTDEQKDLIIESGYFTKEQEDQIRDLSAKELQEFYTTISFVKEIFAINPERIENKKGFDEEQIDAIVKGEGVELPIKLALINSSDIKLENKQIEDLLSQSDLKKSEQDQIKQVLESDVNIQAVLAALPSEQKESVEKAQSNLPKITNKDLAEYQTEIDKLEENAVDDEKLDSKYQTFIMTLLLLILSYILLALSNLVYNVLMAIVSSKSTKDMRHGLFGKLQNLSIRFFDTSNDGDVLSRFTNDVDNISNAMNQTLVQVLSQAAMLIGVIIMMFREDESVMMINNFELHNVITWSMVIFAIIAIIAALIVVSKAQKHVSKQQNKLGVLNGYIDERISAQKVIITNGLEEQTIDGFEVLNNDLQETSIKGQIYSGVIMPIMNGFGLINLGVLVFMGSIFVANGDMSVGLLVAFINYSQRFFQPLGQIFSQYNILELAVSGAARIREIFEIEPEITSKEDAIEIDGINGEIELKNVTFGYDVNKPVLKDINIKVSKGKKVALVGPTGSGKTTVMNLLNRFYDINEGEIIFDQTNIQDMTLKSLRKNVGIVLQESVLFSGTLYENISYGKSDATKEEVESAAKLANIHEFIMELDEGYDTQITNESNLLSVGQKQLMSIARTILTDPDLLILDEATSNVDTVTEAKIQKAMENVMTGRTSFVIAHRLKTILDSDEIVVLKDGEIIEKGNHEKLLNEDGFYAELYNNQFVVE